MPLRTNPIRRPLPQHLGESSSLRTETDTDDLSRMHYKLNALAGQVYSLTESLKRTQQELDRLRLRKGSELTSGASNPCPAG